MLLSALLACQTAETIAPTADEGTTVGSCGDPVYVAIAGYDDDEGELADAHAATFGSAPDPTHLHLSWAYDPSTSVSMVWRTDADTRATQVQYGTDTGYGATAAGGSFFIGGAEANGRVHEVHICDLQPNTTYHYRVGGDGHWSPDHTFTTAPAPGTEQAFRFGVAGDSRDNQATWGLVLDAMDAHAPDFYMFSGDAVSLGVDMVEWDAWFDAGVGHFESRPLIVAHGNHEFQAQPFYALFAQPGNEQWFSFDFANAHFVMLNDTVAQAGDQEIQAAWMEQDLAATAQRWRFAFHHMPAYSSSTTHGSDLENRAVWSPVEEAGGVAIDFAGHNHNYERSYPMRNGVEVVPEQGTTYVVSAGAGAPLYGNDLSQPFTQVAAVTENFLIVEVDGRRTTVTAYDLAGNVLDTFTTTR